MNTSNWYPRQSQDLYHQRFVRISLLPLLEERLLVKDLILCSLTDCLIIIVRAAESVRPKSENRSSACVLRSSSIRMVILVVLPMFFTSFHNNNITQNGKINEKSINDLQILCYKCASHCNSNIPVYGSAKF